LFVCLFGTSIGQQAGAHGLPVWLHHGVDRYFVVVQESWIAVYMYNFLYKKTTKKTQKNQQKTTC
jgi:hypothetical protein